MADSATYDWLVELINQRLADQNWGDEFDENDIDCIEVSTAAEKLIAEIDASIADRVNDLPDEDEDDEDDEEDDDEEEDEEDEEDDWIPRAAYG